jgi:hypothetical protein
MRYSADVLQWLIIQGISKKYITPPVNKLVGTRRHYGKSFGKKRVPKTTALMRRTTITSGEPGPNQAAAKSALVVFAKENVIVTANAWETSNASNAPETLAGKHRQDAMVKVSPVSSYCARRADVDDARIGSCA